LGGQVETLPMSCQADNDTAMFFGQTRRFECPAKVVPFPRGVFGQTELLGAREIVYGSRKSTEGFLHALVGGRELESRIEGFQVPAEFFPKHPGQLRLSSGWLGHCLLIIRDTCSH